MPAPVDTMQADSPMRAPPGRARALTALIPPDLALDLTERAAVIVLFLLFADRMLPRLVELIALQSAHPELIVAAAEMNIGALLLVVSEGLAVVLIAIRRRSGTLSSHPLDWALSFAAVNAPLLAVPASANPSIPSAAASALMFTGLLIQIFAKATLWRSFGIVPANRGVKTSGLYRFLRHPIYAGYTLTHIGFLLGFPSARNTVLYLAVLLIEVARLLREEALLGLDPVYRAYVAQVRYRLLPGIF